MTCRSDRRYIWIRAGLLSAIGLVAAVPFSWIVHWTPAVTLFAIIVGACGAGSAIGAIGFRGHIDGGEGTIRTDTWTRRMIVPVANINAVEITYGLLEALLGVGSLRISTASSAADHAVVSWPHLRDPETVAAAIRRPTAVPEAGDEPDGQPQESGTQMPKAMHGVREGATVGLAVLGVICLALVVLSLATGGDDDAAADLEAAIEDAARQQAEQRTAELERSLAAAEAEDARRARIAELEAAIGRFRGVSLTSGKLEADGRLRVARLNVSNGTPKSLAAVAVHLVYGGRKTDARATAISPIDAGRTWAAAIVLADWGDVEVAPQTQLSAGIRRVEFADGTAIDHQAAADMAAELKQLRAE